jgi:RES domain-containing protein
MRVWRISLARYADDAFSGRGGLRYGARWHAAGTQIVYTSESLALAALEFFVNWNRRDAPEPLVAIAAEIPGTVRIRHVDVADLPTNWRSHPVPGSTQRIGSEWAASGKSAVLSVPSVVVPQERNYLLNPAHGDFKRIKIAKAERFSFDGRMWK